MCIKSFFSLYKTSALAAALARTANRLRPVQRCVRLHVSSYLQTPPPSPCSSSEVLRHGHSSLLRSILPVKDRIKWLKMDQRCSYSTSSTDTTSKPNPETSETKGSEENEKSGGSKSSDGNSDKKAGGASGKDVRGGPVSWMSFFLLVATGAGLIFYYDREKKRHIEEINDKSKAVKEGPSAGKAAIGGPFSLIRDDGKRVTEKDFKGKWSIIYFGFTHCPDICPDELIKLSAAIDKIKENSGIEVVPVFISVDPERDTVEQVHEYVREFHPKLVGLTGTREEIKSVARAYRVYYMKTAEEDSDYLVDHSIVMYLMSPEMDFVKFYGKNHDVDSLTDGVIKEIRQYRK